MRKYMLMRARQHQHTQVDAKQVGRDGKNAVEAARIRHDDLDVSVKQESILCAPASFISLKF